MKYLIIIIPLLTGCGGIITSAGIDEAAKVCAKNEGIKYLHSFSEGSGRINCYCNNGAYFRLEQK